MSHVFQAFYRHTKNKENLSSVEIGPPLGGGQGIIDQRTEVLER